MVKYSNNDVFLEKDRNVTNCLMEKEQVDFLVLSLGNVYACHDDDAMRCCY